MGMYMEMATLSEENIRKLLGFPPLVWKVLAPDDPEIYAEAAQPRRSWLDRLFGRRPEAPEAPALETGAGELLTQDLDKAWHGIHYLLTGSDWEGEAPFDFIVRGGAKIGDIDVGYGPARAFTATETAAIESALADWNEQTLRDRYNPEEMLRLDIYPRIWDFDPAEDDAFGYCAAYFADLQRFLSRAVSDGVGMVVRIG